jgi:sulfur carrier protein
METSDTIPIVVNGEAKQTASTATVAELLALLGLNANRVAVERNLEILPRVLWASTKVLPGDRYEIVQFVGGG